MNKINQKQICYKKKRNIKSNKNIKTNKKISLIIPNYIKPNINLLQRRNLHIFSPLSTSNNQKVSAYLKSTKQGFPNRQNKNKLSFANSNNLNNNLNDNIWHYNTINEIAEDNLVLERPKVNIRIHSTKHNNTNRNTISSEKNNSPIRYKIHRIKPKNLKYVDNTVFTPNQSKTTISKKNINYSLLNSIPNHNSFDSTDSNITKKNKEYSYINYYYNIMQEKNLKALNNNIENLIKDQKSESNSVKRNNLYLNKLNTYNKIFNKNKKSNNNYFKKIVYKRKIQRKKNNYSETFSDLTFLNSDKENEKKYLNKNNHNNKSYLDNLTLNDFKKNNAYEIISYNYQTPNKSEFFSNNEMDFAVINYSKRYSSILIPTFSYNEPQIKKNKEYIKIENYNNNLIINNNNKGNTINLVDPIITNNNIKYEDKLQNYSTKGKFNSVLRIKNSFDYNSSKNSSHNIKKCQKESNKNKYLINYYIKNNWNKVNKTLNSNNKVFKNINKNKLEYSANFNNYNTINDFNIPEKKLQKYFNYKKSLTNDFIDYKYYNQGNISSKSNLYKNELLNKKYIRCNKFKPKKLKNVITSIQCKSKNKDNEIDDKNIILSELDNNGKLNVKVKKLENSIEKVLKENSIQKMKNIYYFKLPKKTHEPLKYIKKNQGTHIKIKKKE